MTEQESSTAQATTGEVAVDEPRRKGQVQAARRLLAACRRRVGWQRACVRAGTAYARASAAARYTACRGRYV